MANYFGSIDLTKLGQIVRQHPELVKTANMRDGTQHQFINIDVNDKQQADQYGNTAYIKVSCKKDMQKEGINYYLTDLKPSKFNNQPQAAPPQQQAQDNQNDEVPF